jgi:thioredoxin reductase
MAPLS